jgi:hypothetical protein
MSSTGKKHDLNKDSHDGIYHSESLGFRTVSIVRNSKYKKTQRFGNWLFPSSGEVGKTPTLLGPLERANLNHWTTHVQVTLPVRLGVGPPLEQMSRLYISLNGSCFISSSCRASSLTRGPVSSLQCNHSPVRVVQDP